MLDNEGRIVLTGIMLFYVGATLAINGIWLIGQARAARMAAPTAQHSTNEPLGHASAVAAEDGKTTVLKRRPARPLVRLPEEHITFIRPGEIAVINIFAGGVGVVTATLLIVMGATQNNLSDVANAAFIMLFGFTYLFIAANQLMNTGNHAFGWFCLFIAISAVPTGVYTLHDAHGNVASIWLGVNWFVWAGLWFCFFLLLAAERPIMRAVGWATVAVAVATCWAYGYATLQGVIAVLADRSRISDFHRRRLNVAAGRRGRGADDDADTEPGQCQPSFATRRVLPIVARASIAA